MALTEVFSLFLEVGGFPTSNPLLSAQVDDHVQLEYFTTHVTNFLVFYPDSKFQIALDVFSDGQFRVRYVATGVSYHSDARLDLMAMCGLPSVLAKPLPPACPVEPPMEPPAQDLTRRMLRSFNSQL